MVAPKVCPCPIPGTHECYLAQDAIKLKILKGGATLNYPSGLHMQSHVSSSERARGNFDTLEDKIRQKGKKEGITS